MATTASEQQALLAGENTGRLYTQTNDEESQEADPLPVKRPWTKARIAWYTFWIILAVVVLGFFIKGWIDADDVDVRLNLAFFLMGEGNVSVLLIEQFDLGYALKSALGGGLSGAAGNVFIPSERKKKNSSVAFSSHGPTSLSLDGLSYLSLQ